MKNMPSILFLIAFVISIVFFACSSGKNNGECTSEESCEPSDSSDSNGSSSSSSGSSAIATLTCENVPTKGTTDVVITAPTVKCGTTTITTGITWVNAPNWSSPVVGTYSNIRATATSGACSGETATCSGTITIEAGSSSYTPTTPGTQTAKTTQYWDACKPSCSWSDKGGLRANSCNITGSNIGHNDSDRSACDGGSAFACINQAPWKVGNVSFGYAAINMGTCGDCYQLDFPNGHVMVVMKSNIGNLNEGAAFDLMIPGGGVGDFDALTRQVKNSGVSNPDMGERYGGFRGQCGWEVSGVSCVKQKCESVFKNLPDLKAGCLWYANTLGTDEASWNNPTVKYQKVNCPAELTNRY